MNRKLFPLALAILLSLAAAVGVVAEDHASASKAAQAFEQLKNLEGHWQGSNGNGGKVEVHYQLTGNGTALLERFSMTEHPEMTTVYHLDGDSILLTHYCIGNQPRMRASSFDAEGEIRFDFVDVSGDTSQGHMHHALVRYDGGDRMSSDWTFRQGGADAFTETVVIERVTELASR